MADGAQALDTEAVANYLCAHLPGFSGPLEAQKFPVGQSNPTFHLQTPQQDYVLRRKPPGVLLKSAHAVDREFRVQKALAASPVPVPRMHLLCQDPSVIGSDFYVMDLVRGRNFNLPTLPDVARGDRQAIILEMARVLAALHKVDLDSVDLADYGPTGNYLERQIARWSKQYRAAETDPNPDMDKLMSVLQAQMPADDGQRTLVHGDYRIDNMIFAANGTDCLALLDWELSTTGHPYADLASVLMQWQMPPDSSGRGLGNVDRATLGLPSDAEFVACYSEHRGLSEIADLGFYVAFSFFRMAAILQGVHRRALDGNASNPEEGLALARMIPVFAEKGLTAIEEISV